MTAQSTFARMPTALDDFGARVHAVAADRWGDPTPCTDWSVRDLVTHVTGEQLWAPHLLRGESMDEVGDRYEGDVLGPDPVDTWDAAAHQARRAWDELARPGLEVHTSMGLLPVEDYVEQMHLDLVVHAWDLARGAGLDATVRTEAAEHVLAYVEPRAQELAGHGVFAAPVTVDSDDPADRLLALLGRDPRRSQ